MEGVAGLRVILLRVLRLLWLFRDKPERRQHLAA
jgi:hypothetical protein